MCIRDRVQRVSLGVVAPFGDDIEFCRGNSVEVGRQRHPVVGTAWLLRQHGDPPLSADIAVAHSLDKPLPDHPVSGDDEVAAG